MKQISRGPLRRTNLKDQVAQLIKQGILDGKIEPGDRIVETKVASDFGVGTTAVREALFQLEDQGFVTRVPNKGTFVTRLSPDDIRQILRVRRELEGLAVELLQERATEEDLALLDKILKSMREAALDGDLQRFYRRDLEFHRTIWSLSGNRYLVKPLDITVVPLFAFFVLKNPSRPTTDLLDNVERHNRVIQAIRDHGDARKFMQASIDFFTESERELLFQSPNSPLAPSKMKKHRAGAGDTTPGSRKLQGDAPSGGLRHSR